MNRVEELFPHYDAEGQALISRAGDIAGQVLANDTRGNGKPFFEHPLGVALIVSDEIALTADCVAAVFLHEASRMHPEVLPLLKDFPADVVKIVDGLNKIATIKPKDTKLEADNYKKLIVQYSTDPRVTVLKIADRLEVMRNLDLFPKLARERKILETLMLYIPLAHQLGLYNIKNEMEDIYFRHSYPVEYRSINNKLKATQKDRQKLSDEFISPLKQTLDDAGIKYKLKVRTKAAYSIFKKMQAQKVDFEGVFDVFAIRFIIDCVSDPAVEKDLCWKVYSYVTQEYLPDTKRLRDWISNPKPNGYESLHITVQNREGASVEVQIRTERMDAEAENGQAAHWSYKGIKHEQTLDKWLVSVRETLENPQRMNKEDLPQPPDKEIFVFTPSGELRILPAGASVLDFAFNIHSGLGVRCSGGRINGKAVSIKDKLKTGDVVEIISSKSQKPSPDWVNWVISSKARNKIKQVLHEAEHSKAAEGKELLDRRLKNWKLDFPDGLVAEFMKKNKFPTVKEFYSAIGDGNLDVNVIKAFILEGESGKDNESIIKEKKVFNDAVSSDDILVINSDNLKGLDYKMAKCCNPVFGDDVFGFVTRANGITIHRISCPNAARLLEKYAYRIQKVRWADSPSKGCFQVSLNILAALESSAVNTIMEVVGSFKASVRSFNMVENNNQGTYSINVRISVPSNTELDKITSMLKNQKGILKVSRR